MADKNLPKECIECYADIREHSKQVFGEIDKSFKQFLEESAIKQDNSNNKVEKKFNQMFGMNLFLLGIFATAIGYIFISNSKKAESAEVLKLNDAKNLLELHDKYSDQRYMLNPNQTVDKYNYQWFVEKMFSDAERGNKRIKTN